MLEPILQQVMEGNPQFAQLIGQNQGEFLRLLSEDLGDDGQQAPPGAHTITVTEEERDAIERVSHGLTLFVSSKRNITTIANMRFKSPHSSAVLDSRGIPSSKHTLRVTRTRNSLQTSFLTSLTMTTNPPAFLSPFACVLCLVPRDNLIYAKQRTLFFLSSFYQTVLCCAVIRVMRVTWWFSS